MQSSDPIAARRSFLKGGAALAASMLGASLDVPKALAQNAQGSFEHWRWHFARRRLCRSQGPGTVA
jgi:hypothetical protein